MWQSKFNRLLELQTVRSTHHQGTKQRFPYSQKLQKNRTTRNHNTEKIPPKSVQDIEPQVLIPHIIGPDKKKSH
jgi:hypothetical protein